MLFLYFKHVVKQTYLNLLQAKFWFIHEKKSIKRNILFCALLFQSYMLIFRYIMSEKIRVQNIWLQGYANSQISFGERYDNSKLQLKIMIYFLTF